MPHTASEELVSVYFQDLKKNLLTSGQWLTWPCAVEQSLGGSGDEAQWWLAGQVQGHGFCLQEHPAPTPFPKHPPHTHYIVFRATLAFQTTDVNGELRISSGGVSGTLLKL